LLRQRGLFVFASPTNCARLRGRQASGIGVLFEIKISGSAEIVGRPGSGLPRAGQAVAAGAA
jgi:hypothetical protein